MHSCALDITVSATCCLICASNFKAVFPSFSTSLAFFHLPSTSSHRENAQNHSFGAFEILSMLVPSCLPVGNCQTLLSRWVFLRVHSVGLSQCLFLLLAPSICRSHSLLFCCLLPQVHSLGLEGGSDVRAFPVFLELQPFILQQESSRSVITREQSCSGCGYFFLFLGSAFGPI